MMKNININIVITAVVVLMLCSISMAENAAMTFLNIPPDARSVGMGEAGVGVADDAAGVNYYNNGGLGHVNGLGVNVAQNMYIGNIKTTYIGGYLGMGKFINIGISSIFYYASWDEVVWNPGSASLTETGGKVNVFNMAIGVSYGVNIIKHLGIGGSIKFSSSKLKDASSSGKTVVFDIGLLLKKGLIPRTSIGLSVRNLAPKANFGDSGSYSTPLRIVLGTAIDILKSKDPKSISGFGITGLTSAADVSINLKENSILDINVGFELGMKAAIMIIYLRAGYKVMEFKKLGALAGLTGGFGVEWNGIGVDYAVVPNGAVSGITQRISARYRMSFKKRAGSETESDEDESTGGGADEIPELDK